MSCDNINCIFLKGIRSVNSLRKLISYLKPYWLPTILAPIFMVLEVSMDLSQPRLLQKIVDIGIAGHNIAYVQHTSIHMLLIALAGVVGGVGCGIFATIAALNFSTSIRDSLFRKVQQLSFANLDKLETGSLITRLTSDVDQIQDAALMILRGLVRAPLLTIGGLIMAVVTSAKLSIMLLVIAPILIYLLVAINQKAHPLFTIVQEKLDILNSVIQENLAGVRVVKAFVRSDFETQRFDKSNNSLSIEKIRAFSTVAALMPGMTLLINLGIVAVIWFGGISVVKGQLHVGQLLAFVNYLLQMMFSLVMVSMALMLLARADASGERIVEVLESVPSIKDSENAKPAKEFSGLVKFENVCFRYDGVDSTPVLQNVSFTAEPGQTIGILGSTGEGKSTLVNLIPRLYDVSDGKVLIDGTDVKEFTYDTLRKQIAFVLQNTLLFSDTIRENIRFGNLDAADADIEEAAKMACAHDFITSFPDGYDTMLGQGAVNLSGGQKQRLSIARALVAKPSILILDDCTSAVDMSTEANILTNLNNWDHKCTRFIIAQRISAIKNADKILVIENCKIAAEGTHEELLQKSELYKGIVMSQMNTQEAGHAF